MGCWFIGMDMGMGGKKVGGVVHPRVNIVLGSLEGFDRDGLRRCGFTSITHPTQVMLVFNSCSDSVAHTHTPLVQDLGRWLM